MSVRATTLVDALPATMTLASVSLTVTDLERSIGFYRDVIGIDVKRRDERTATLGTSQRDLVELVCEPAAVPAGRHAGMYHFALLFESREELGHAIARVVQARVPVDGATDHGSHEALYLPDPDGNGIELAADRSPEHWVFKAEPLDTDALLALVRDGRPNARAGDGSRIGHVHLHVASLSESKAFYVDAIGFDLVLEFGRQAAFLSVGGYHHHLAFNLWRGGDIPPAPPVAEVVGLREWRIALRTAQELQSVRDRLVRRGVAFDDGGDSLLVPDPARIPLRVAVA